MRNRTIALLCLIGALSGCSASPQRESNRLQGDIDAHVARHDVRREEADRGYRLAVRDTLDRREVEVSPLAQFRYDLLALIQKKRREIEADGRARVEQTADVQRRRALESQVRDLEAICFALESEVDVLTSALIQARSGEHELVLRRLDAEREDAMQRLDGERRAEIQDRMAKLSLAQQAERGAAATDTTIAAAPATEAQEIAVADAEPRAFGVTIAPEPLAADPGATIER